MYVNFATKGLGVRINVTFWLDAQNNEKRFLENCISFFD